MPEPEPRKCRTKAAHFVDGGASLRSTGVAGAAGPVDVCGNDELALGVDEDALTEDAARGEGAVVVRPPLVAVAAAGDVDAGAGGGGLGEPVVGHDGLPEITWALVPGQTGRGFATEGARRALQAGYEDFGWTTAVSVVSIHNPASQAVARRMGATLEREISYRHGPAHLYRHVGLDQLLAAG